MNYPTDIVSDDYGWGRIHAGHDLPADEVESDLREHADQPQGTVLRIDQVYFTYVPRVKWCGQLGIFPCDQEGNFHAHWVAVQPNERCKYTTAFWEKV